MDDEYKDADAAIGKSHQARFKFQRPDLYLAGPKAAALVVDSPKTGKSAPNHFLLGKNGVCVLNKSPHGKD